MEGKKIVFNSNTAFSLYNFRLGLMKTLKERGFQIYAVAPYDRYAELLKKEFEFFEVCRLDRKGKNPVKDLLLLLEYVSLFKRLRPDLVINYTIKPNIYGSLACGLLGIGSISVITGLGYVFARGGLLEGLVRVMYALAFRFNSSVLVLNSEDAKIIRQVAGDKKVVVLKGEGVNTDYFSPDVCEEKDEGKVVFLYLGRFLKDKGIIELVQAGKRLAEDVLNFQIWLVGAPDSGNPESISQEELEKIKNLPFVKVFDFAEDVRPYICMADCVVLPSYREGIPRALLEAMAMGKPIITTDAPGCRDVIIDGINGFMARQKDVESLYLAMKKFINLSAEQKATMGKESRKIVLENFDERIIIKSYMDILSKIHVEGTNP